MVYLLIAEEMGLVGLAAFLLIVGLFFRQVWLAWSQVRDQEGLESILLGLAAAVAGILVGGIFDHYFFNLDFPHAVAVFWLFLGLGMAAVRLGTESVGGQDGQSGARAA
ncbi:MAG: O-antigen ligase domain-containing protein, partial [Anaerolineae bacterium]|jgi:O-antigen ligase